MARKGGSKEGVFRDSSQSMPVEQKMTSESSKQKIAKILDMFPSATKDQIAKILQYYDDDENKAIDAITRDGGIEALSNWAESGNFKSKNNKNKKKKKKGKKEPGLGSATASFDADDSSSLHSSGNVDAEIEKECSNAERNGVLHDPVDENKDVSSDHLNSSVRNLDCSMDEGFTLPKDSVDMVHEIHESSVPVETKCSNDDIEIHMRVSPVSDNSDKQDDTSLKKEKYRSVKEEGHLKHLRQRTNSFRRSKTSSLSEDSSAQHNPQAAVVPTKRGYEKCKKDLNRQSISLQRIHSQVEKSLEESTKRLKSTFNEIKKLLEKRQEQLELELAKTKEDALNILKGRQDLAVELKRRVDRTPSLTEAEWSELRSDVKQFVTERKYDDELGKTIWFQWSVDPITENINKFGEVQPVKNVYSQRSHSALGNVITQNNPEPSPSSSVVNEEISSAADKNDVANMLDTVDDEVPAVKQDVPIPVSRNQPSENRSRIFSNTKFQQNNRGHRGYNNRRGYGYSRPNNRNFNYRNNFGHHEYSDNRNHSHQERDGRIYDISVHQYDRNLNSHRNNRNDRRGQSMNYRSSTGRFRGNLGQQRQNNENVAKIEPISNETPADIDKANVVNGYANN